jgi:hypothetical protein
VIALANDQPAGLSKQLMAIIFSILGVPAAIGVYLIKLTQNIWLIGACLIVYWLIVNIISFTAEVGEILKKNWAKRLADWLDYKLHELFSHYRKKYLKHLYYQFRDFDVKGMSTQGTLFPGN